MFKKIILLTVPTFILFFLLLEILFNFIIPASELPDVFFDDKYKLIKFNKNQSGYYSIGKFPKEKFRWKINNEGWNNEKNYYENKTKYRIAIIGDSYVEALQVNVNESFPSIFQTNFPDIEVYSFGISGSPLSNYYQMIKYISKKFNPDFYIVNVVDNDYDESLYSLRKRNVFTTLKTDENPVFITPNDSSQKRLINILNNSSTFRYFYHNLMFFHKLKNVILEKNSRRNNLHGDQNYREEIKKGVSIIVDSISTITKNNLLFVVDGNRHKIYNNGIRGKENFYKKDFISILEKKSIKFLDLDTTFSSNYNQYSIKFNSDLDYHWNSYGHAIVAEEISNYLNEKVLK